MEELKMMVMGIVAMMLVAFVAGIVVLDLAIKSGGGSIVLSKDGWLARASRSTRHRSKSPTLCQVLLAAFGTVAGRITMVTLWVAANVTIFVPSIQGGHKPILMVSMLVSLNILVYALYRGIVRVGEWLPATAFYARAQEVGRRVDSWEGPTPSQMVPISVRSAMSPLSRVASAGVRIAGAPFILAAGAYQTVRNRACPIVKFE